MVRWVWGSAALILLLSAQPVQQARAAGASHAPGKKCDKAKKGGGLLGSIAGSIAGSALGSAGVPSSVGGVYIPVSSILSDGITRLLNCKEQRQAAEASREAARGGPGTTVRWESENRPGVSGTSTARARTASANGDQCMLITDVVIVDGEETTVDKRMCRSPGGGNYVVAT